MSQSTWSEQEKKGAKWAALSAGGLVPQGSWLEIRACCVQHRTHGWRCEPQLGLELRGQGTNGPPLRAREGDKEMPRASGGCRPPLSLPKSCSPEPQPHSGPVLPRGEAPPVPQPHSGLALPEGEALPEQQQAWQSHPKRPTALCPAEGGHGAGVTPAFSRPSGPLKGRHPTGDPRILSSYVLSLKSVEQNKTVTNNSCGVGNRRQ